MRIASFAAVSSVLVLALAGCHKEEDTSHIGVSQVSPPDAEHALDLKPLPKAPAIQVDPEALPGANGELAVVTARPQGDFQGIVRPTLTFSKPVMSLESIEDSKAHPRPPVASISPAIEGEWRWLGSASAEFVPKGQVPYSTEYQVTVTKGLRAIDGSQLKSDYVYSFKTPALKVQSVSPRDGDHWVKADASFKFVLNQPVDEQALAKAVTFEVEGVKTPLRAQVLSSVSVAEERRVAEQKANPKSYQPAGPDARGYENQQWRYEVAPEKNLPLATAFHLRIQGTLHGKQGPLPMGKDYVGDYRTYGPMKLLGVRACTGNYRCPTGPLMLSSSNEVDVATLKSRLHLTPPAEIDWTTVRPGYSGDDQTTLVLPGKFTPGTEYAVRIDSGVGDIFHQTTGEGLSGSVHTDDLDPSLSIGGHTAVIESSKGAKLPIRVTNLKTVHVDLWKLTPAEFASLTSERWNEDAKIVRPPDVTMDPSLAQLSWNQAHTYDLDLSPVLKAKSGAALVRVSSKVAQASTWTVAQVTDLAVHVRFFPQSSVAWVTRLSDGTPVANAAVTVMDSVGSPLWSGQSGPDGLVSFPGASGLKLPPAPNAWEVPTVVVSAAVGEDLGLTSTVWDEGITAGDFGLSSAWAGEQPNDASLLYSERGIYKPGETVDLAGVIRFRQNGELKAPAPGSKMQLSVTDESGNAVLKKEVVLNAFGTFSAEVPIEKDAPLGSYSVSLEGKVKGGPLNAWTSFRVAEYRVPQFKVDVTTASKSLLAGDVLKAQVMARYLFGGAMSDAKTKWSVVRSPSSFSSETETGYSFGDEAWWLGETPDSNGLFASGSGAVDAKGALSIDAGAVEAQGSKPWSYTVEAEVTDVNRQAIAGRVEVMVHPADHYVGIKELAGFGQVGKPVSLDVIAVDLTGKRTAGQKINMEIDRHSWTSIQRQDATGGFVTESQPQDEKVAACEVTSATQAVPCAFTPKEPGLYLAKGTYKDAKGRSETSSVSLYVTGAGFVMWDSGDTDRVDLTADKKLYDIGDVAHVLVKSPYPDARALVTVERDGVMDKRVVDLHGSAQSLDIPITAEMIPDAFVSVMMVHQRVAKGGHETGRDPNRPGVKVGLVQLSVEKKSKRLEVTLKPEKPTYEPGQDVAVDLNVKDWKGQPVEAQLTVYAVDEAVLRLTGYQVPDPITAIFPDQGLSARVGEPLIHLIGARSYGEKGEESGGGGAGGPSAGPGFRSNFKTTAYFNPAVVVDASGHAKIHFKLPDNLTTFRLMAVAVSKTDRFGSGTSKIEVSKPLLALAALPRFGRLGDSFEAGVVVHSNGAGAGEVTVTASVTGAKLAGPAEQKVQVTETAPKEVRFPFVADHSGTAVFHFTVQRGDYRDAVEQKIPIELPAAVETVATYGDTTDQRVEGISPPKDVFTDVGGLNITLASTALGNFQQGMRQLVDYPYGCLEQQSSRLVPFVALREIAGEFGVAWAGPKQKDLDDQHALNDFYKKFLFDPLDVTNERDPDQVIAATVKSIQSLQNPNGSFRYWADDRCADSWTSAYATMALARAQQVGFKVDPEVVNKAQGYLEQVAAGQCNACEHACPTDTRVFATYVLARSGTPKPSFYSGFYAQRAKLPLFDKALLADAIYTGGGDRAQARELMKDILNHAQETPKGVHFEETNSLTYAPRWSSDTRTTGVVLQTLTDISPDHPYVGKIAHYLQSVREGDGRWRSTQEAAFSLMGLTEMIRTKEKATPDYVAQVMLGDTKLDEETFQGRSLELRKKTVPMADLAKVTASKLTFQKKGEGVLYYSANLQYAPKALPMTPLERGLYVQRWFEPYAGGGQTTHYYAGDLVRVRLRVATTQERNWTAFEVPLPAGLEPVDTSLATTASQPQLAGEESNQEGAYNAESGDDQMGAEADDNGALPSDLWNFSFWSPFNHVETRDSKVVFFADHLPPGVHVVSFVARATTPGKFLLKPASGSEMYEPEVFGRSEGGTFEIELPKTVSER